MKRLLDVLAAMLALVLLSIPLAVLAIQVRRNLGSPVFFRQMRPGLRGQPFQMVKFRTMTDARGPDDSLLADAQRLTSFGKFLRSSSLDELPELWNVLKGDMSLVGPRPLLMEYLPLYSLEQARRHEVRPGITGWAQVNGRNTLSWEVRCQGDTSSRPIWKQQLPVAEGNTTYRSAFTVPQACAAQSWQLVATAAETQIASTAGISSLSLVKR